MAREIQGAFDGKGLRFGIVVSRFNDFISTKLLEGALDALGRHEVGEDDVTIVRVPGSYEIPLVAKRLAATGDYDGVLCLGAIIRGQTPHFDYVAAECAKGVARASEASGLPVIFGVLTTDNLEQAIERAGTKAGNKGADAAMAAIETADLLRKVDELGG